ncbi:hypothetical protein PENTCL1PPCAC_9446, partial [Pristionchus entomophagus]
QGSVYQYSQENTEGEEGEEIEEDEDEREKEESGKYAIVEETCLLQLFKRCQECGEIIDMSEIKRWRCGSARTLSYDCLKCRATVKWESQEKVGSGRGQVFSANHSIPIAAFITGTPIPRLCDFANLLDLDLPSDRTMRKVIREIGSVAIERVFRTWQETVREVAVNAAGGKGLQVSIDGQFDSPGHTASNCKVTVIDCETKLALAGVAMHERMEGIDGISCRMESEGTLLALTELVDDGIPIRTRVGVQNGMVNKILRENAKTEHIIMKLDWWHAQKPLRKEWWKLRTEKYTPIYRAFFIHLYHMHHKYPEKDDRPRALEVVQSFVMHIQGKHKWDKSDGFQLVTECEHGQLKRMKKGEKRLTLKAGSPKLELVREMLHKPRFGKAFLSAASLIDTAINESYHSLSLMYSPKRAPLYYQSKMWLSMLHFNSMKLNDLLGTRNEIGNSVLSRKGRVVLAIKRKRSVGEHTWREEIMEESIRVRDEQCNARVARRIGMPEDDIFDDLTKWWEEKEEWYGLEEEAEEEEDEGEEE